MQYSLNYSRYKVFVHWKLKLLNFPVDSVLITSLTTTTPVVYWIFQHYMFNMESRHLLNLSAQNALDCISENFNVKNFPRGACARNSLEKYVDRSPDGRYRLHIATVHYISRSPLSQNPPSAPVTPARTQFLDNVVSSKKENITSIWSD